MTINFLEQVKLYANTFFKKSIIGNGRGLVPPDGQTQNQVDYVLMRCIHLIQDVNVLARFTMASDHRLLRTTVIII